MANFIHCSVCDYLIVNASQPCPSCGEAGHVSSEIPPVSPPPAYQPNVSEYTPGQRQFEREERLKKFCYVAYTATVLLLAVIAASVLTFVGRGDTGRDSRSNDRNSPAPASGVENIMEQPRLVAAKSAQTKVESQEWRTEIHGGINFKIGYSWEKKRTDDGSYWYYPPVSELPGVIRSYWDKRSIGNLSLSDADARWKFLDEVIAGSIVSLKVSLKNVEEINRAYFKIGYKYAARASFYYDDKEKGRCRRDAVCVLFEDGIAILASSFTVTKYEPYKDMIEITLGSVALERRAAPDPVQPLEPLVRASVFSPRDISDNTIRSIETYNDYLLMLQKIVEDYLANYDEAAQSTTGRITQIMMTDTWRSIRGTFGAIRQAQIQAIEQQRGMYGRFGDADLIGKDDLVRFLIGYRDNLKVYSDSMGRLKK